jgi:hypothetical protein
MLFGNREGTNTNRSLEYTSTIYREIVSQTESNLNSSRPEYLLLMDDFKLELPATGLPSELFYFCFSMHNTKTREKITEDFDVSPVLVRNGIPNS